MDIAKRDLAELDVWPHQLDAIRAGEAYFASGSPKGCLIHMPTGTGKTGVMAVLATRRAVAMPVLVVCPSAALVEQLKSQFVSGFWDKIKAPDEWKPDVVIQILPSGVKSTANKIAGAKGKRVIVVGTIQALQQIHAAGDHEQLRGLVGTIIFDEGHREPAPLWAEVVRSFGVPTVLFSATPFRSDLKIFNVGDEHIHFLSFQDAVGKCLIRGVTIEEKPFSLNAAEFVREMIAARDDLVKQGRFTAANKMIVRAASEDTVTELFQAFRDALKGRDDGVLALHNNFDLTGVQGEQQRPDVPINLTERPEKFLIHQFMLIEGIDDPLCTMLALYEPFSNTRMLVQQVGRLTRQAGEIGTKQTDAIVFARVDEYVDGVWKSFLSYDTACIANGGKPPIRNDEEVLSKLVAALPLMDYVGGEFRERIDLADINLAEDLQFPRSAYIFEIDPSLNLDNLQSDISAGLEAEDRFEHLVASVAGGSCRYHVTLRLNQSPFLSKSLFQAASLEVTIYARCGNRLFFYDSAGLWIDELNGVGARVNPKSLRSLMPAGPDNVVSFISVKNTDLGPLALRSRSLAARSLERSGVFMGEHMNVVTRAGGRVENTRRSVGFARSRVRDGEGADFSADEFAAWCDEVNKELDAAKAGAPVLSRFAIPTDIPSNTEPTNILIDMLELMGEFRIGRESAHFDNDALCVDVVPDFSAKAPAPFRFELTVDGNKANVWISWNPKKQKYWITSPVLSKYKSKDNEKISLTKRLNQIQPFRLITAGLEHVYVHGSFYALDLNLANLSGAARLVLDLITPVAELAAVKSEKGIPSGGSFDTWKPGSLFRMLDDTLVEGKERPLFGPTFPALVCDDLATEVGDFIGVDDSAATPRVTFVVAKWHKGDAGVSASAFYDVCAQAVKNLAYLKSDGTELPGAATKFDNDWRMSAGEGVAKVTDTVPRRRAGPGSIAFRRLLQRVRTAPGSDRTIWLVCSGGMLSKSALEAEFRRPRPQPHVLQFYHLVISAYSACQSVGVNMRIFCPA
ncbi:DEAD/DEAH box helicase [Mesorhizobium sp. ArgA1]